MHYPLKACAAIAATSLLLIPQLLLPQPTNSQVFEGFNGCPAGTEEGSRNFIFNGFFSTNAGTGAGNYTIPTNAPGPYSGPPPALGFTSQLPYRGDRVYPDDVIGGLSILSGPYPQIYGPGNVVRAIPFPGDPSNRVPASDTFLYSNPGRNLSGSNVLGDGVFVDPIIWQQVVSSLTPNTSYNFSAYFFNLLDVGAPGNPPIINYAAGPPNGPDSAFVPNLTGTTVPQNRQWLRVQGLFRTNPGQTALELRIQDNANTVFGDDFGFTAAGFRECVPFLGVAKQAGDPQQNADGSFTIPYTITVRNFGPANPNGQYTIRNVQLQDNLGAAFAEATIVGVTNLRSSTLTVNRGFNGTTDQNLLAGTDSLNADATATVNFDVTIVSGSPGPFDNVTLATGISPGGEPTSDRSTTGTNPDPNGNRNPTDTDEDVPTTVFLRESRFRLVKRITNVLRGGAPLAGVDFNSLVLTRNPNDAAPGWAQLQPQGGPVGLPALGNTNLLQSGDEVEYTVYFLSDGDQIALETRICDQIPQGTQLVPDTNRVKLGGTASVTSGGTFYSPLAPLPADNGCPNQTNPNGSLIFNLGDIPNTAPGNVGYVQFRVRIL
jgi:uncharacterized repeat protein (TIGR01451 family)